MKPLDLLLMSAAVRFCGYNDTHSVLGNTYGLCVLQDLECLTPNILCRVVETVRGGGAIVLLLPDVTHLRELSDMDMDAHYRLTTHSHPNVTKHFNNRLVSSLAWCSSCVVLDEHNKLSYEDVVGLKYKDVRPATTDELCALTESETELSALHVSLSDAAKPLPQLAAVCKTPDQAKCVLQLVDVVTTRRDGDVVSVTAGRGRGKSAALGLAVAAAIDLGLNNIFVTSPTPHNLTAFFQLLFAGFDALDYKEGSDYEVLQSTNAEFSGAIVRVTVYRNHRQTIQYVLPCDHQQIQQAELVVVDEAAAIPLPQVQAMMGTHITIMASTISGYEGTGRSLSLKLLKKLRTDATADSNARSLHELSLERSIRYGSGDPVEAWLHKLLCLSQDVSQSVTCPAPQMCQLYYVNKPVLLSGNKASEQFLQKLQSLLVSSHYRNSPDDLQVLADAPAHHLFVLLPPLPSDGLVKNIPTVLCVVQVCLEGGVTPEVAARVIRQGERPPGDLAPWTLASQFSDSTLATHVGGRIIRVATHPHYQSMGYGSRALGQLKDHYSGRLVDLDSVTPHTPEEVDEVGPVGPRKLSLPLLTPMAELLPQPLDYLSVSYGITPQLYKFWAKADFIPLYVGQIINKTTGEHSCLMVQPVSSEQGAPLPPWLVEPCNEFLTRFMSLLGGALRDLHPMMAYDVIRAHQRHVTQPKALKWRDVECDISGHDLRRLEKYSKNLVDWHLVTDLVPAMANLFCRRRLQDLALSNVQAALLVGSGLQNCELVTVGKKLDVIAQSTMALFNRTVRRVYNSLSALQEQEFAGKLASVVPDLLMPVDITVEQDMERLAKENEEARPDLHFHKKRSRDPESYGAGHKPKKQKRKNKYSYPT